MEQFNQSDSTNPNQPNPNNPQGCHNPQNNYNNLQSYNQQGNYNQNPQGNYNPQGGYNPQWYNQQGNYAPQNNPANQQAWNYANSDASNGANAYRDVNNNAIKKYAVTAAKFDWHSLLTTRNKIIAGIAIMALAAVVGIASCSAKNFNNKTPLTATANSDENSLKNPDADDQQDNKYDVNDPEKHFDDVMSIDYASKSFDELYDKNWLPIADSSTPAAREKMINQYGFSEPINFNKIKDWELYFSSDGHPDYSRQVPQQGMIFKSEVIPNDIDEDKLELFVNYFKAKAINENSNDFGDSYNIGNALNELSSSQLDYIQRAAKVTGPNTEPIFFGYADRLGYKTKYHKDHDEFNWIRPMMLDDGSTRHPSQNPHLDSIDSMTNWMRYDAHFYNVSETSSGVVGTCRLGDLGAEVQEIVLPSLDNPDKFDVFIDDLSDVSRYNSAVSIFNFSLSPTRYADLLRRTSKTLPFKVVLHNVDRPLRADNNEVGKVSEKFGLAEEYLNTTVAERYQQRVKHRLDGTWDVPMSSILYEYVPNDPLALTDTVKHGYLSNNLEDWIALYKTGEARWNFNYVKVRYCEGRKICMAVDFAKDMYRKFVELDRAQFGN